MFKIKGKERQIKQLQTGRQKQIVKRLPKRKRRDKKMLMLLRDRQPPMLKLKKMLV